jgi:hypothetical protein
MGLLLRHRQYAYHLDSWRELEEFRSFVDDAAVFVRHFGMPMANQQEQTLEIAGRAQEGWQQEFSQVVHLTSGLWTLRIVP